MGVRSLPVTVSGQGLDQPGFSLDQLIGAAVETAVAIQTAGGPVAVKSSLPSSSPMAVASTVMTPQAVAIVAQQLEGERGREAFASAFRLLANDLESWQVDRAVILSLGAKIGRPEFTLVEGSAFKNINRKTRTGEISLGVIQSMSRDKLTRGIYAGFTITAGSTYTGTQRQTCMPIDDIGVTQCRNALLAEPGKTDVELYQGELRYYFDSLRFAVGFRPGYNRTAAENEKWSIELPIMFLQNSKDLHSALTDDKAGLTGGLTVGWKDSPAGTAFYAVFSVGSLFKLPGVPQ